MNSCIPVKVDVDRHNIRIEESDELLEKIMEICSILPAMPESIEKLTCKCSYLSNSPRINGMLPVQSQA